MPISLKGASHLQAQMSEYFWSSQTLADVDIEITVVKSSPTKAGGFTLNATRTSSRVSATIGLDNENSFRYALNALVRWLHSDIEEISLDDGPDFPVRGVVEGFYGKAWTHEQRLRGLKLFGDYNMNTYFLAPKDVPWQRFNWRAPFTSDFLTLTDELIQKGRINAVDVAVCVSPGLSVKYSDQSDVMAVVTRYKQLFDLGARHFGLD